MAKRINYTVVSSEGQRNYLSNNDKEMDKRAISVVKSAVEKAVVCKI